MTSTLLKAKPLAASLPRLEWLASYKPVPYLDAVATMDSRVASIARGGASECIWLLQRPPLYTAGTSADPAELLDPGRLPVFRTGRGGRFTYHGPGQRVAYAMLDLSRRDRDVRAYVSALETWLIATLAAFGVRGERRPGAVGIFVDGAKIASIGVRVRRWVTFHGVSLNVDPDLAHFSGIVPCGLADAPVTSLAALCVPADMDVVDAVLRATFDRAFPTP